MCTHMYLGPQDLLLMNIINDIFSVIELSDGYIDYISVVMTT